LENWNIGMIERKDLNRSFQHLIVCQDAASINILAWMTVLQYSIIPFYTLLSIIFRNS